MTEMQMIVLGAIGAYFLVMIGIGLIAGRDQSHEGFVIGNRDVGYIPTMGSLATSFRDGMGIIFWFGFGALTGYGGMWLFLGSLLGMMVYVFVGPRVRKIAAENDYITIGEMLRARYGVITERCTAVIVIIFAMMLSAVQLYVAGNIFSTILGLEAWIGIAAVSVIVGFYLFFGGYSTVVKTDAIQFLLIISLIVTPFFFAPPVEKVLDFASITSLGLSDGAGLFLIGFFYVLGGAETWQRVFSARDDKVIRYSFPLASVMLVIMTLAVIFLGMASAPFLGESIGESEAFFAMFKGEFIPAPLLAFIAVVVMAICMSTLDTFCYLIASTLGRNFMPERVTGDRKSYITFSRAVMVLTLLGMSVVALTISDVIVFAFDAASLMFILAPVYVFAAIGWPRVKSRMVDGLVASAVLVCCIFYLYLFSSGAFADLLYVSFPAFVSVALVGAAIFFGTRRA